MDPSIKNLWKLSRPSSNPQANITFEELAKTAGFKEPEIAECLSKMKYELGSKEFDYCVRESAFEESCEMINAIYKFVACEEGMTVRKGTSFSEILPDVVVNVDRENEEIKEWLFIIQICRNETMFKRMLQDVICQFILLDPKNSIKFSLVVDNNKYFEFLKRKAGHIAYKGNFSVMYYNRDKKGIDKEILLAQF